MPLICCLILSALLNIPRVEYGEASPGALSGFINERVNYCVINNNLIFAAAKDSNNAYFYDGSTMLKVTGVKYPY